MTVFQHPTQVASVPIVGCNEVEPEFPPEEALALRFEVVGAVQTPSVGPDD